MLIDGKGNGVPDFMLKGHKIIMFGASTRNKAAIDSLHIQDNVLFFVDSDGQKAGQKLDGYQIYPVNLLYDYKDCLIVSVLVLHYVEVLEILHQKGIDNCFFYYQDWFDIEKAFSNNKNVLQNEMGYRYIHIFSNDKFIIPFYQMLEERFQMREHLLILAYRIADDFSGAYQFVVSKCEKYHNILILDDVHGIINHDIFNKKRMIPDDLDCNCFFYTENMENIYRNAEKILLHSAFWGYETKRFIYTLTQTYAEKMVWLCFGGDVYYEKNSFVVSEILSQIGRCSAFDEVIDTIWENYGIHADRDMNFAYYVYVSNNVLRSSPVKKESVNILLGHSSFDYVDHMLGIDLLKKFSLENIKIYVPLVYGSNAHKESVIQYGKIIFGNKFIPITEYMQSDEYIEFLKTIDVAVFPLKRKAGGMSTLLMLKALSVKIYADLDYITDFGFNNMLSNKSFAENIYEIENQSFEEFTFYNKQHSDINCLNDRIVSGWKEIFDKKKDR